MKKEGDRGQQVNQKIVHIELGDSLTDFTSSYKRTFDGAQGQQNDGKVDNNIRQSNLVFGFGGNGYQTSSNSAHNSKPISTTKGQERSYVGNVLMGSDAGNYHSEAKAQFAHK